PAPGFAVVRLQFSVGMEIGIDARGLFMSPLSAQGTGLKSSPPVVLTEQECFFAVLGQKAIVCGYFETLQLVQIVHQLLAVPICGMVLDQGDETPSICRAIPFVG